MSRFSKEQHALQRNIAGLVSKYIKYVLYFPQMNLWQTQGKTVTLFAGIKTSYIADMLQHWSPLQILCKNSYFPYFAAIRNLKFEILYSKSWSSSVFSFLPLKWHFRLFFLNYSGRCSEWMSVNYLERISGTTGKWSVTFNG